jgi:hypothetical protein
MISAAPAVFRVLPCSAAVALAPVFSIAAALAGPAPGTSPAANPNQPPVACVTVKPERGTVDTVFSLDAGCSSDDSTAPPKLRVRWDWEEDSVWDTDSSTTRTALHSYLHEGLQTIRLEVTDSQGLSGTASASVLVLPTLTRVRVGEPAQMPGATEPDIAVDPSDPRRMIVAAITGVFKGRTEVPYPAFHSTDAGSSWARSSGMPPSHSADPAVEMDARGNVFLSTLDASSRDGTPTGIVVARSTDGGQTFPEASYAMDPTTRFAFPDGSSHSLCGEDGNFFDYPKLAVDRGEVSPHLNNLYVIANGINFDLDGDGTCETASHVFIRSRDAGLHWESGQSIPGMRQYTSSLGIALDGTIYISDPTINTPFCSTGTGIALRKSVNGGESFLPATCALASEAPFQPDTTWTAADPTDAGKVAIAFSTPLADSGGSAHVFVIHSGDAGSTWSAPVRVDDVLPEDGVDHLRPSLSISSNGRLDLIWFDYRDSKSKRYSQNRQSGDVYYSFSVDGGETWAPNLRLSASTAPLIFGAGNDALTIVSSGDKAHAVYAQDQNGNVLYETYLTTITFH